MDQLIYELDLGVNILLDEVIKSEKTDDDGERKGDAHIIPAMFEIIIYCRHGNGYRQGINKN